MPDLIRLNQTFDKFDDYSKTISVEVFQNALKNIDINNKEYLNRDSFGIAADALGLYIDEANAAFSAFDPDADGKIEINAIINYALQYDYNHDDKFSFEEMSAFVTGKMIFDKIENIDINGAAKIDFALLKQYNLIGAQPNNLYRYIDEKQYTDIYYMVRSKFNNSNNKIIDTIEYVNKLFLPQNSKALEYLLDNKEEIAIGEKSIDAVSINDDKSPLPAPNILPKYTDNSTRIIELSSDIEIAKFQKIGMKIKDSAINQIDSDFYVNEMERLINKFAQEDFKEDDFLQLASNSIASMNSSIGQLGEAINEAELIGLAPHQAQEARDKIKEQSQALNQLSNQIFSYAAIYAAKKLTKIDFETIKSFVKNYKFSVDGVKDAIISTYKTFVETNNLSIEKQVALFGNITKVGVYAYQESIKHLSGDGIIDRATGLVAAGLTGVGVLSKVAMAPAVKSVISSASVLKAISVIKTSNIVSLGLSSASTIISAIGYVDSLSNVINAIEKDDTPKASDVMNVLGGWASVVAGVAMIAGYPIWGAAGLTTVGAMFIAGILVDFGKSVLMAEEKSQKYELNPDIINNSIENTKHEIRRNGINFGIAPENNQFWVNDSNFHPVETLLSASDFALDFIIPSANASESVNNDNNYWGNNSPKPTLQNENVKALIDSINAGYLPPEPSIYPTIIMDNASGNVENNNDYVSWDNNLYYQYPQTQSNLDIYHINIGNQSYKNENIDNNNINITNNKSNSIVSTRDGIDEVNPLYFYDNSPVTKGQKIQNNSAANTSLTKYKPNSQQTNYSNNKYTPVSPLRTDSLNITSNSGFESSQSQSSQSSFKQYDSSYLENYNKIEMPIYTLNIKTK